MFSALQLSKSRSRISFLLMAMLTSQIALAEPMVDDSFSRCQSSVSKSNSVITDAPIKLACATCGCSELCPLTMLKSSQPFSSALTDSIWGNLILKIAYQRDPELQRLAKRLNVSNIASYSSLACIAGGTIGQNIASMVALNPPDGIEDSYGPGTVGLSLSTVTNIIFGARAFSGYHYRKKMKERQLAVRQQVERLLEHLEFSKTDCSEAQAELSNLIGEKASKECLQLWQSSHLSSTEPNERKAAPSNDSERTSSPYLSTPGA